MVLATLPEFAKWVDIVNAQIKILNNLDDLTLPEIRDLLMAMWGLAGALQDIHRRRENP